MMSAILPSRALRGLALMAALGVLVACERDRPWNVLVVTLDTTRADFLGCYGRATARTAYIDRLAADGALFEQAVSAVPVTLPSHSTIFTGLYPPAHGVRDNGLFQLPDSVSTLAEVLKERGYATAAAIGSFPLARQFGTAQGFDVYDDHISINAEDAQGLRVRPKGNLFFDERSAAQVNDAILPWLRSHLDRPFFAWIHYWDAHHPHIPPEPFHQLYQHDLYQGEIAFVDQSFGAIVRTLEEAGVYDRTLIVLVGDHGEGRGEHYEDTHSQLAYDSTLHVPLILKVPGLEGGRRIKRRVGTVDIMPTVLDLLEIKEPLESLQGRSLADDLRAPDRGLSDRDVLYAETLSSRLSNGWGELRAMYRGKLKYIHGPRPELFDLEQDPRELRNLVASRPDEVRRLRQDLEVFLSRQPSRQAAGAIKGEDAEIRRRLAALGYLSSSGDAPDSIEEKLLDGGIAPQDRIGDVSLASFVKNQLSLGDYLKAEDGGRQLVERDPRSAFYRGLWATAWLGLDRPDRAADVLEDPSSRVAQNDKIILEVARELWSLDHRERALALLKAFLVEFPNPNGHYLLGEMLAEMSDQSGYERELRSALALDGKHPPSRLSLAILLARSERRGEAEAVFSGLVAEYPLNARYQFNFAVALLEPVEEARQIRAMRHFERAIELNPVYWVAYLQLLSLRLDRGERAEAQTLLRLLESRCREVEVIQQARNLMKRSGA